MRLIKSLLYIAGIARDCCDACGQPAVRRARWSERETECAECIEIDRELEAEELAVVRAAEFEERAMEALRQMTTAGVPRVREITPREAEAAATHAMAEAARQARIFGGAAVLMAVDDDFVRLARRPAQPPMPGRRRD